MISPAPVPTRRLRSARIAALLALAAVLVGSCGNPPSPSPSASQSVAPPSPEASASASPSVAEAACTAADLVATGGRWDGAAGSRGSDIVVVNQATAACLLPAGPTIAMVDPSGTVLLANTPPQVGTGPSLAAGARIGFSLIISNWCEPQVNLPLHFGLALATEAVVIGGLAVQSLDDLPPCNGPGLPPTLWTTEWQPG